MLLNNPHFHLPYKKATIPEKKHSSLQGILEGGKRAIAHSECFAIALPSLPDFALQVLS